MKKLLTLLLAVAGMVTTASATKLYVYLTQGASTFPNGNARIMAQLWNNNGDDVKQLEMTKEIKYGKIWYSCELDGRTKALILRQNPAYGSSTQIVWNSNENGNQAVWNQTSDITGLSTVKDNFGNIYYDGGNFGVWMDNSESPITPATRWTGLAIRSSKEGWDGYVANTSTEDGNTFTKTYTKAEIESVCATGTKFYFKFKHVEGIDYDESGSLASGQWKEIHVSSDTELPFGTSTDETVQTEAESGKSWYIIVPSYDYDKIVFTAAYVNEGGSYKWVISADAYIKKTISAEGIATFGSAAPVDFTNVTGLTAQKGKVGNDSKITFSTATTLAAGEGALLSGAAGDYYIPVAASADADTEHNDFVAITTKQQITETMNSKNAYILAKVNDVLGFYKPAEGAGSWCAAGTAYLATTISAGARGFFPLWDDATAIETAQQEQVINGEAYNLAGQRVAQPTKGLYIVNGKKVILK